MSTKQEPPSHLFPRPDEVLSVGAFTQRLKSLMESSVPPCWVQGEVSNLRRQSSGHAYFTIKDEHSQLSIVLFRANAARQSVVLRDGMQLTVYGELSLYEPRGNYQLIARVLLEDGLGRLRVAYDALKAKLEAEGLFDRDRKQALPALPRRIGIITSPTGAAIQDFISILRRRSWTGELIVFPAQVQGAGAVPSIMDQIGLAGRVPGLELLVLSRGGGSLEDLWAFNEEALVRAVAACPVPTLSAVGHETDVTLCDFAASARAETPSGAAERISSHYIHYVERYASAAGVLESRVVRSLNKYTERCAHLKRCLLAMSPRKRFEYQSLRVDDASRRLTNLLQKRLWGLKESLRLQASSLIEQKPTHALRLFQSRLQALEARYIQVFSNRLDLHTKHLAYLQKRLDALSLSQTLRRGFALIRNEQGLCVDQRSQLKAGERISAQFKDGTAQLEVKHTILPS